MSEQQMPARIWVRICGGGVSLPSGRTYTTLVGEDRKSPNYAAFVRAELAERMAEALEKAVKLAKLAEELASCGADDEYVWGLQEEFESALSAFRSATQDTGAPHD